MAGGATPVHPAFHADLRILDEPGRALVRADHAAPDPARLLRQRQGPVRQDRGVRRRLQRRSQAVPVDGHKRRDLRETRASM